MFRRIEILVSKNRNNWVGIDFLDLDSVYELPSLQFDKDERILGIKYFFTELGWKRFGINAVKELKKRGECVKIIEVDENEFDVYARDDVQVCGWIRK